MRDELQIALLSAQELPVGDLPRFLGELEEIRCTAMARLGAAPVSGPAPDALLDVNEAAERLGVSASYLYRNHGRFGFSRRVGRALRFSALGIQTHISRGKS